MKKMIIAALGTVVLMSAGASTAQAGPSFNCRYAKTPAEHAICDYRDLSRLDRKMSKVYFRKLRQVSNKYALKQEQRGWLRYRNSCGYNASCLRGAYRQHIKFLRRW